MTMSQLIRARKSEDKALRKEKILKVTKKLFESQSLESITMDLIAKKADLAKGTLYLYFKTKEEVFLDLQKAELFQWMRILKYQLETYPNEPSAEDLAGLIVSFTEHQNSFLRLLSLLYPVLEENVPTEKAKQFKLELKEEMLSFSNVMAQKIPSLNRQNSFLLLFRMYSLILGLWQTANPLPKVAKIMNDPDLAIFKIDFGEELKHSLIALIKGMPKTKPSSDSESKFNFFRNY